MPAGNEGFWLETLGNELTMCPMLKESLCGRFGVCCEKGIELVY